LEYLGSSSGNWPLLFFLQRRKYMEVTSSNFHWKKVKRCKGHAIIVKVPSSTNKQA